MLFGIELSLDGLINFFSAYAYRPELVYAFVVGFMLCSSFGLPIPEEFVLISVGFIAYLGKNPEVFPPPYMGATPINMYTLMAVCFFTVWLSDIMIFCIGKFLGKKMVRFSWVRKKMEGGAYAIVEKWFAKYGYWCVAIFRFTPGIRFPGQMFCGFVGVPLWAFSLIDFFVALISVPTQVWLAATYGEQVAAWLKEFKVAVLIIVALALIVWAVSKILDRKKMQKR